MTNTETFMGYEPAASQFGADPPEPRVSPAAPEPPRRPKGGMVALLVAALFASAFTGAAAVVLLDDPTPLVVEEAAGPAEPSALDPSAVGAAVIPSVVAVQVGSIQAGEFVPTASGSGVVIDAKHIITNDHVVGAGESVQVVLSDGRVYQAEVVGTDPITDVAVLSVAAPDLAPLPLGSTKSLTIGAPAIAVGSPLGLDGGPSLSVGVVSALGREVQTGPEVILYGMIQTDAPITNGSSGGALVDRDGALIGITTAVGASELGIEGIGFATPIEIVTRVAQDIIDTGNASHALLGILGSTAFESIGNNGEAPIGVTVEEVTPASAAEGAGIRHGQIITAAGGVPVRTMDELITVLRHYGAGDRVTIELVDAEPVTLQLGAR